jgi:hypothetical protein
MLSVEELYQTRARRNDSDGTIEMRGTFRHAPTHSGYIFHPNDDGEPTLVVPVFDGCGLIDIVAIDGNVYGAVTGAASYLGTLTSQCRVHRTPTDWLAGDDGILPLAKSFYPLMRLAESI